MLFLFLYSLFILLVHCDLILSSFLCLDPIEILPNIFYFNLYIYSYVLLVLWDICLYKFLVVFITLTSHYFNCVILLFCQM